MVELEDLHGVGPKLASTMRERGILTADKVAIMRPSELKADLGITLKKAKDIILDAKDKALTVAIQVKTAEDILDYMRNVRQKIDTGSVALNSILTGGICTDAITGFAGEFATGKTQICHQVAVNCIKMGRKVAWIETEPQTFNPERILEIATARGIKIDLKDILVVPAKFITNTNRMFGAYELIKKRIEEGMDIGLVVIDSFTARFRSDYTGRTMFSDRSAETARHFGMLERLCSGHNLAVVLTVQVMGVPDAPAQLGIIKKQGIRKALVGGHYLKHSVTYWVALDQVSSVDKTWKAIVFDAPVPRADCIFKIDSSGIRDAR